MRISLSHRPILYACVGGVGIVLFWKGVWETAELFPVLFGPVSFLISVVILLLTGLLAPVVGAILPLKLGQWALLKGMDLAARDVDS